MIRALMLWLSSMFFMFMVSCSKGSSHQREDLISGDRVADKMGPKSERFKPILQKSCVSCHHQAQVIDLTHYPFAIKGSFAEDRVKSILGAEYQLLAAQKIVAEEILNAMESGYMPPPKSVGPPLTDTEVNQFKLWMLEEFAH